MALEENPFVAVKNWVNSLEDEQGVEDIPVDAIKLTVLEAFKCQEYIKLSVRIAGYMFAEALEMEKFGARWSKVNMVEFLAKMAKDLELPDVIVGLQTDPDRPGIISKSH